MAEPKIAKSVTFSLKDHEALETITKELGVSCAAFIRAAVTFGISDKDFCRVVARERQEVLSKRVKNDEPYDQEYEDAMSESYMQHVEENGSR